MVALSFLRHGQTVLLEQGNVLRGGRTNDFLTVLGYQQMMDGFGAGVGYQAIFSSPLSRCLDFAKDRACQHGLPLFVLDELQEIDFGDWEAQNTADLYEKYPNELTAYWQTPHLYTPPNAESVADFQARIMSAVDGIHAICERERIDRACVISHGGVIKMLYVLAKNLPISELLSVPVELGACHEFEFDGKLRVKSWRY